jgi:hypothetical protein
VFKNKPAPTNRIRLPLKATPAQPSAPDYRLPERSRAFDSQIAWHATRPDWLRLWLSDGARCYIAVLASPVDADAAVDAAAAVYFLRPCSAHEFNHHVTGFLSPDHDAFPGYFALVMAIEHRRITADIDWLAQILYLIAATGTAVLAVMLAPSRIALH